MDERTVFDLDWGAKQQYHALMAEDGILQLDASEMEQMAKTIRRALAAEG